MTISELKALNYTKGGNNYVLVGNKKWVAFIKNKINLLKERFNDDFNIVICWGDENSADYICVPYNDIKHLLVDEHLTNSTTGSLRWTFIIKNDLLCVHANSKYSINIAKYLNRLQSSSAETRSDTITAYSEGKDKLVLHKTKERTPELISKFKSYKASKDSSLSCEVCGFSFKKVYGDIGDGYIEAHHITPISMLTEERETTFDDLILVCANCHRMLHRQTPPIDANELKRLIVNHK